MKNILFISPYGFKTINGGTILFNEFFKSLGPRKVSWFICSESNNGTYIDYDFKFISYYKDFLFNNVYLNFFARKIGIVGFLFFFLKYNIQSFIISYKLERIIKNNSINRAWIYTSHSSIAVLYYLLRRKSIDYHLSIQDDYRTHLPAFESNFLRNKFKFLIENANSIDFISTEMEVFYRKIYKINAKSTVFFTGKTTIIGRPKINRKLRVIGYAGNIWCGDSFLPLLEAIKILDTQFNIKVKLKIFTQIIPRRLFNSYLAYIDYYEFVAYENLINELQLCDLLYLPMTFDKNNADTNLTSFPSKILSYLNSGIPILNHSPIDSATNYFVVGNEIGFSVNSLEPDKFIELINNPFNFELRQKFSLNASIIFKKFDSVTMLAKLKDLVFR